MKTKSLVALVVASLLIAVVVSATAIGSGTSTGRATVKAAVNSHLKTSILVDGKGRTVYLFLQDTKDKATCATADPQCPKIWPAFATVGKPIAGRGVKASLLGTTKGAHGVQQVTYNHHPLYYFAGYPTGDKKPGDIRGQAFGTAWYVVSPKGAAITKQ